VVEDIVRAVCAVSMADDARLRALRAFSAEAEARRAREARARCHGASNDSSPSPSDALQPTVTYLRLHDEEDFTVGAFVFDRGQAIPLHNHPGMTVAMRCLFGETRITSYDFVDDKARLSTAEAIRGRGVELEVLQASDEVVSAADGARGATRILYPNKANVHSLFALSACAMLEVQTPPYRVGQGRDCHYFELVHDAAGSVTGNSTLREIAPPPEFVCGPFRGVEGDDVNLE
jgi:cysteamine dioxygenase